MHRSDIFEVVSERSTYHDRYQICWRSRVYGLQSTLELRAEWFYGARTDPRRLVDYIERLIGGTLENFARLEVRHADEMARALWPIFEREIHEYITRLEYSAVLHTLEDYFATEAALNTWRGNGRTYLDPTPHIPREADEKARKLLVSQLDALQKEEFERDKRFKVAAKDGKTYTIEMHRSFNVIGPDGTKYCGQTTETPVADQMLAQKLLLENDPDKFFKNANVSRGAGSIYDWTILRPRLYGVVTT